MNDGRGPEAGDPRETVGEPPPAPADDVPREPPPAPAGDISRERRPLIERIGLAAVASVLAVLFGGVAAASWIGGEPFLAAMGAIGCLMTAWVGALTLFRG